MKSISHSPNSDWKQQVLAASYLFFPWKWGRLRSGSDILALEKRIADIHGGGEAITFSAGREGLLAAFRALGITEGDEVIIQGYTCIVVPNAVIWSGAKPVYVDVDATLNLNPDLIEGQITKKTKAIIVQHTFGIPADMNTIQAIAQKHNLKLIEDCAHSLGAEYEKKLVGTFGDIAFFSFGRDKIISSISGGAVYTQNSEYAASLRQMQRQASKRSFFWIKQNLLHPLLVPWMAKLMGNSKVGGVLMLIAQKAKLLNKVYTKKELCQEVPNHEIHQLPNAMATMALQQLSSLEDNLLHRTDMANYYRHVCDELNVTYQAVPSNTQPAYLRFTIFTDTKKDVIQRGKKAGYLLGNWYNSVVMPEPKSWEVIHLNPENLPVSKTYTEQNVNLPTSKKFNKQDVEKILRLVKNKDE